MIALGTSEEDFDFDVCFKEVIGGPICTIGLFFGYRKNAEADARVHYQTVVCKRTHSGRVDELVDLDRLVAHGFQELVASQRLDRKGGQEKRLGITVTRGKVTSVRWNGAETTLKDPLKTGGPWPCTGKFGVWCAGGTAVFRNCLFQERKRPRESKE